MKKMTLLLLAAAALFSGCSVDDKTITVEDRYTLTIPGTMTEVNVNADASLQYADMIKNLFVIVIDESKSELHTIIEDNDLTDKYTTDLDGYVTLILSQIKDVFTDATQGPILETEINGLPARTTTLSGNTSGVDLYYYLSFVEGADNYYQVMTWTASNMESKNKSVMEKIAYSLVEL